MPSINLNVVANYASFVYAAAISLAVMPLLHQELGSEYFGLVGIYVLLMNIVAILDLGLSTTVSRECAVHRNNPTSAGILPHIIRVSGLFFYSVGGLIIFGVIAFPDFVIIQWLKIDNIPQESVRDYMLLIILSVIIRWISGLYRGVINGFERQITTSIINALSATLRFPVAYALILQSNESTNTYFQIQVFIALIEYILLYSISRKLTHHIRPSHIDAEGFKKLFNKTIRLAASISILTIITTLYTQIDKIILAKILPLGQYGDLSLILVATTGIASLAGPVSTALIPRLTNLIANRNTPEVFDVYINSQRILLTLMIPCGISCIFLAPRILFVWTGNVQFSTDMAATFGVYAMGNVIWVISALPGYLKYASGEMNFLLKYNLALLLVYAPSALIMGLKFGPIGAGLAWLAVNALSYLASHAIIHREFFSPQSRRRIVQEVSMASAIAVIIILLVYVAHPESASRFVAALHLLACLAVTASTVHLALSAFSKRELKINRK